MRQLAAFWFLLCVTAVGLRAAEKLPPPPARYFNDYAHVVSGDVASKLNQKLEDFEKATSSQIVVAVFDKLPPNSALEDFTVRSAQSWRFGTTARLFSLRTIIASRRRIARLVIGELVKAEPELEPCFHADPAPPGTRTNP